MPAERAPMRKVREVLRLRHALGASERQIAHHDWGKSVDGRRVSAARCRYRHHLAGARGTRRCRTGAAAVHATDIRRGAGTAVARLVPRPQGTEAARRDAVVTVGGIPGRARRRLRLQPVLRPLPRLVQDHLEPPCGRRTAPPRSCSSTSLATRLRIRRGGRGERRAHIFVTVLGASNYTYAEARWSKGLPTGSERTSTP